MEFREGAFDFQTSQQNRLKDFAREQVLIEILNIEDKNQRNLATNVIKKILDYSEKIDDSLTSEKANIMIKEINEKIQFIKHIINQEMSNQSENIHDPYKYLEIPIYDF